MIRLLPITLLSFHLLFSIAAAQVPDEPAANPGRPTVSTPAALTPVGYLQFETGFLGATHSPEFSSQSGLNEVVKFSVSRRIELLAGSGLFAHSRVRGQPENGTGDVSLGVQGVLHHGEGARPTLALSYFRRVYGGNTPDLDFGSARNSVLLLASADVKGFHYDTNYFFNEVITLAVHRAQFGQTLSVSHSLGNRFGVSGEIWHFTQPPGARRRLQPRTHQHVHTMGSVRRFYLFAAAPVTPALTGWLARRVQPVHVSIASLHPLRNPTQNELH